MTRLTARQVQTRIEAMQRAALGGAMWDAHYDALIAEKCRLLLPLGELLNPAIAGHVFAWQLCGALPAPGAIPDGAGLNAQGIEGAVAIQTDLFTALRVAAEVGPGRCSIWTCAPRRKSQ
jgi:hypothetical protein